MKPKRKLFEPPARMPSNAFGEINPAQLGTSAGEQVKVPKGPLFTMPGPKKKKDL